tara:strand:+ start:132 stop:797 length:666 start_codon:yes stop_codon:yes gene_type:complete
MFKFVALIPARKGSKGIKNKNLKKINGYSLVELAVRVAIKSKIFNKIILSTDSNTIIKSVSKYGIITHKRSKVLSKDKSHISKTIKVIKKKFELNKNYYLIILEPTSPLRIVSDIKKAHKEIIKNKYDSICTFTEAFTIPYRSWTLDKKEMKPFLLNNKNIWVNRQQFGKFYQAIGHVVGVNLNKYKYNILFGNKGYLLIDKSRAIDIDDIEDLKIVKKII